MTAHRKGVRTSLRNNVYLRLHFIGLALLAASDILSPDSVRIHCNNIALRLLL